MIHNYEKNGQLIYNESFATIRSESNLDHFSVEEEVVAVRMIHACGMIELAKSIFFYSNMAILAREALESGAPILCDTKMVSEGITRTRLPQNNEIICTLNEPSVPKLAAEIGNTRSAAAVELWKNKIKGGVVAIGNAPTALFHLLNMLDKGLIDRPAAIIGCPVGFVGAKESKVALSKTVNVPSLITKGRLGGSAITVAAINALASRKE